MNELTNLERDLILYALSVWQLEVLPHDWQNCFEGKVSEIRRKLNKINPPMSPELARQIGRA